MVKKEKRKKNEPGNPDFKPNFIFVVDDDPLTIYLNEKVLTYFGANADIQTFETARDALSFIDEMNDYWNKINEICILLDLQMMEMDGIEFLKRLKKVNESLKIRVYIISGSMPVNRLPELNEFLLAGFFLKPLTKGNVREVLMPLDLVYLQ